MIREDGSGWATSPVTESGFVRVSCNARVIPDARSPAQAIELLRSIRRVPGHTFWTDDVSPADEGAEVFDAVVGHRQVTDAHLLTLAIRRGGRLATFDRGLLEMAGNAGSLVELIP